MINNSRIFPYSVNSGHSAYPDIEKFVHFLEENINQVIYVTESPENIKTILKNLYVLGRTANETDFPIQNKFIKKAIIKLAREGFEDKSLEAFNLGLAKNQTLKTIHE